jgi:hypothetical protein
MVELKPLTLKVCGLYFTTALLPLVWYRGTMRQVLYHYITTSKVPTNWANKLERFSISEYTTLVLYCR